MGSNDNPGQGHLQEGWKLYRTREGKELVFLTNRWDLEGWEVCDTYKAPLADGSNLPLVQTVPP